MDLNDNVIAVLYMLVMMAIVLLFAFALSRTKFFGVIENGKMNYVNCGVILVSFGILSIIATRLSASYDGAFINIRDLPVMIAGLIGGPVAGLGAGLIGGVERYLEGGTVAIPCMIGTVLSGIVGGMVWMLAGRRFPKIWIAAIAMLSVECVHMLLVAYVSASIAENIAAPMIIFNVLGIVLFGYLYRNYLISENDTKP
ncbi:MAG: LytS/YhcK type 5TM receptor domain-containing protein [Candidatus Methanomethylophilaceae archaeon]